MSRALQILKKLAVCEPPEFETPIDWVSNGERGHLHTQSWCDKVRRSSRAQVVRKMTIHEALSRKICEDCSGGLRNHNEEQDKLLRAAITLFETQVKFQAGSEFPVTHPEN